MEIEIINSIGCRVLDRQSIILLRSFMYVMREYWKIEMVYYNKGGKKSAYRKKVRKTYPHYLVGNTGYFLTGFLPRIEEYCTSNNIIIRWSGEIEYPQIFPPFVSGIEFRPDQLAMITAVLDKKRGVLKAPTQSGKTIVALGIVSSFLNVRILYLAHTISICGQVAKEFEKYGYEIGRVFSGKVELDKQITVATRQSLSKQNLEEIENTLGKWTVIILDEVHHLSSFKGQYADIFMELNGPVKIGLTATLPTIEEGKMAVEGFIGPVIGELNIQEASELGIIATPKIKLIKVPSRAISVTKYAEIYQLEIVENRSRNRLILEVVKAMMEKDLTSLIFVTKIEHGDRLQDMARLLFDMDVTYIQGSSEGDVRESVKEALLRKETKCIIATAIWKEGVSLPSLDCVVNACGGKSEIATLQSVGRGLSQTGEQRQVTIVDFLDTAKYLSEHTIRRLHVYVENGWL